MVFPKRGIGLSSVRRLDARQAKFGSFQQQIAVIAITAEIAEI
jgi:hypothetical protein